MVAEVVPVGRFVVVVALPGCGGAVTLFVVTVRFVVFVGLVVVVVERLVDTGLVVVTVTFSVVRIGAAGAGAMALSPTAVDAATATPAVVLAHEVESALRMETPVAPPTTADPVRRSEVAKRERTATGSNSVPAERNYVPVDKR